MNRSQNTKYSDKQRDGLADHLLGTQNSDDDCVSMSEAPHSSLGPGQGRPKSGLIVQGTGASQNDTY